MSYNTFATLRFELELKRLVKKFPSLKEEYSEVVQNLNGNPKTGTFVGKNCYKIRLAIKSKGKGKRAGARIITYVYVFTETIYLLTIFDKSEKPDLIPNELEDMINSLDLN